MQPKKGRAVLWPATFNERPFEQDARTHHEALPVLKGIKYAALLSPPPLLPARTHTHEAAVRSLHPSTPSQANFWLHQYDYVDAHHRGCTAWASRGVCVSVYGASPAACVCDRGVFACVGLCRERGTGEPVAPPLLTPPAGE